MEPTHPLAFDVWKLRLRKDCELRDKLDVFDAMGDYVLSLLWGSGIDPSIDGILGTGGK